ncbi:MAG: NosD domain-containing protein [Thermoplasmata archaeon]
MKRRVAIIIMVLLVLGSLASVNVRADVVVNDIVTVISDHVNGSKAVAGALLNFTGSPPFGLVTFQWFSPNGSLAYEIASEPDDSGLARSNYTVDQTGAWWVNASYSQPPDVFYHNVSFQVLDNHWNSSFRTVVRDIVVGDTATLTVDAGATIAFDNGTRLSVFGTLIAQGTWNQMIVFTSNSTAPAKEDWDGVYFHAGSESSVFEFVNVEYSGNGAYVQYTNNTIENCLFEENIYGIRLFASTSFILNNTMENNTFGFQSLASHPVLISNTAVNNTVGFRSEGSGLFASEMNIARDNEQTGFHLDITNVQSKGDTSVGSMVALRLGSSSGTIEGANISGLDDGVYSYDSMATIRNSTVSGSLRDFFLEAGSSLVIVNSTFGGKVSAGTGCPPCYLFVRNYLTVRAVTHGTSDPIENATVEITDNGVVVLLNLTDSQGYVRSITVAHETYEDGVRRNNSTMVSVTHPTFLFAYSNRSVDMNLSHTEIFEGDTEDTDGDGEPDFSDLDDDSDGLSDDTEASLGTDPLLNDTDGDTMPDGWEHLNSLDPKDPSDAGEDLDGDGFTNLDEYRNDTNPNNPHSHPPVEDQQEEDVVGLFFLLAAIILLVIATVVILVVLRRRWKE